MSNIYNTPRTLKGKGRSGPRPNGPTRSGLTPQQMQLQEARRREQLQQQQPQQPITYNDFQLLSSARRGKHHLMDFKSNKKVDPKTFARPVKLHRKESSFVNYRNYANQQQQQQQQQQQANKAGENTPNKNEEDLGGGDASSSSQPQQQQPTNQQQHGPKTGADTSLIAPMGGATRNKQMLFKKRTKQIYLAKEDTRELKEQEQRPWILEDYDGQNSFTGTYEGGQRSDYFFFVLTDNGFKVMPVDRWYKFQPKRNFKKLSLEEAEEQLKLQHKKDTNRWMMLNRTKEEEEEKAEASNTRKFKIVDNEERTKANSDEEGGNRDISDIDDIDFDDVFQDDEEGIVEHEVEDEDVKDGKERVKKEINSYSTGNDGDNDDLSFEELNKLSLEGKQLRKLVRNLEKNHAYESDEDKDPYASSDDQMDSDAEDDEEQKNENEMKEAKEKEKKIPIPPKKKALPMSSKPMMPKKAHTAKVKKEAVSKPIGRPGSPSLYREGSTSPPRSSSPSQKTPSSPQREVGKKHRIDSSSGGTEKHRKIHSTSSSPAPSSPPGPASSEDLITEQEVINTLRGKKMTTKEFLMSFRKRIKKDQRNRDIISNLLKKVARHTVTGDDNARMLELKPELQ
ncbi:Rap30/74 interaction domain-containing protein [Backusella circina FSU 941]|nr:Rap30/74 interaction domain-containing protein [Backusella circina FSU 941]